METEFKPGDEVCHKANPRVMWVIEEIKDGKANCSTLTADNKNQKEVFALVTIKKYERPQIIVGGNPKRNNHY